MYNKKKHLDYNIRDVHTIFIIMYIQKHKLALRL